MSPLHTVPFNFAHRNDPFFLFFFWHKTPTYTQNNLYSLLLLALHQSDTRLDVVVRPHGWHLALERLERELERRARVPDLELLQHARVQDA